MTMNEFHEAERLYNTINNRSRAIRETYAEINRDCGYDPMMATAGLSGGDTTTWHPEMVVITRTQRDNIREYARFIGRGVDMTSAVVVDD